MSETGGEDGWQALATAIKHRRSVLGLSIDEASDRAGVSDSWWRQLETGRRRLPDGSYTSPNPRGDFLGRVARALGVELDSIMLIVEGQADALLLSSLAGLPAGTAADSDDVLDMTGLPEEDQELLRSQWRRLRRLNGVED